MPEILTAVKERPILFSGPMVRAILEGRKTQTRRIVSKQPPEGYVIDRCHYCRSNFALSRIDGACTCKEVKHSFGYPSDRLWVRESFRYTTGNPGDHQALVRYTATPNELIDKTMPEPSTGIVDFGKHRPGIHMPRWASRILLEVTGVRCERLQDIPEVDAINEGIDLYPADYSYDPDYFVKGSPNIDRFARLWDEINGKTYPWDSNPWVWVIAFRRLT